MSHRVLPQSAGSADGERELQEIQLACFRVGEQMYALDIRRIKEIIRPPRLTPIPKAPPFIEGVFTLRNVVIPVLDLRKRFGLTVADGLRKERVLVCALFGKILGLRVDEVTEVRRYTRKEVYPSPYFLKGPGTEFFAGVCRYDDDLLMILDLEKVLSSREKLDLEKIPQLPDDPFEEME